MTDALFPDKPTEEDVAAIAAVLFGARSESFQEQPAVSAWVMAARREGVEKWEQPTGLSRIQDLRDRE